MCLFIWWTAGSWATLFIKQDHDRRIATLFGAERKSFGPEPKDLFRRCAIPIWHGFSLGSSYWMSKKKGMGPLPLKMPSTWNNKTWDLVILLGHEAMMPWSSHQPLNPDPSGPEARPNHCGLWMEWASNLSAIIAKKRKIYIYTIYVCIYIYTRIFKVTHLQCFSDTFWGGVTLNWWLKRSLWRTRYMYICIYVYIEPSSKNARICQTQIISHTRGWCFLMSHLEFWGPQSYIGEIPAMFKNLAKIQLANEDGMQKNMIKDKTKGLIIDPEFD